MHNVFTYHEPIDCKHDNDQWLMIDHWRRSWAKQGWNPVVLGLKDAERHPLFREFDERTKLLPTVNPGDYELACYRRWLAVARAGGGFMSDYDVVNYGFKPTDPTGDLVIYESNNQCNSVVPSVVGGTAYGFLQACLAFSVPTPESITSTSHDRPHTSDMVVMQILDQRHIYNICPTVIQYGHETWDTAPLVHYSHATTHNTDRVQCLKSARPI